MLDGNIPSDQVEELMGVAAAARREVEEMKVRLLKEKESQVEELRARILQVEKEREAARQALTETLDKAKSDLSDFKSKHQAELADVFFSLLRPCPAPTSTRRIPVPRPVSNLTKLSPQLRCPSQNSTGLSPTPTPR